MLDSFVWCSPVSRANKELHNAYLDKVFISYLHGVFSSGSALSSSYWATVQAYFNKNRDMLFRIAVNRNIVLWQSGIFTSFMDELIYMMYSLTLHFGLMQQETQLNHRRVGAVWKETLCTLTQNPAIFFRDIGCHTHHECVSACVQSWIIISKVLHHPDVKQWGYQPGNTQEKVIFF